MSITIIILAAGKGVRMGSSLPKVMHPIAGFPMIEYLLDSAIDMGVEDVRVVLNSEVITYIEQNPFSKPYEYKTIVQKDLSGTASALSCALAAVTLKQQVLVLYADSPLISVEILQEMLKKYNEQSEIALVSLGFYSDNPRGYGRMLTVDDYLLDVVEEKDATAAQKSINLCNSGIMLANSKILQEILPKITNNNASKEYYLTDAIKIANQSGYSCSFCLADELEVMGVNSQSQLADVNFIVQTKLRQKFMKDGVMMYDPNSTFLSKDTKIAPGVIIEPFVYIGPNVTIGKNSIIKAHSYIEGAIIEENCSIGPFARIRPTTHLEGKTHIGNFVEVKNSQLSTNVKASHLSYIGDAQIGSDTNIGAGAVFCNYDGVTKHRTEVGVNSFIGSNSSIIAPRKIGDGVIVAAGSVITADVNNDELAVSRGKQKNIVGKGMLTRKKNSNYI